MPHVHDNINTDYFTDNKASGGTGGTEFNFVKEKNGAVMKKIEAWKDGTRLRGVKVYMTDGTSHLAGTMSGEHGVLELAADETITRLNIQPKGSDGQKMGAIWIKTSKGRDWGIFSDWLSEGTQYWVEVGSGLCCGIYGRSSDDLDQLGMAMLRPVKKATLEDVTYPNLDLQVVATTPTFLSTQRYDNSDGSMDQTFTLRMEKEVTVTKSWSSTVTFGFSQSVTVSAGIPGVADVDGTMSWSAGFESTQSMQEEERKTLEYEWPVNVPAGKKVKVEGKVYADQLSTEFKGTMNVLLENGKVFSYPVDGNYEGANYSRVDLAITED